MPRSAHAAYSHTVMSIGGQKSFSAQTQPVPRTPSPRDAPFISAGMKRVSSAFAQPATRLDPGLTKTFGRLTKKTSHPYPKRPQTRLNTDSAQTLLLMYKSFPTFPQQPTATNHLLTLSKTSHQVDHITNLLTPPSPRKILTSSHN